MQILLVEDDPAAVAFITQLLKPMAGTQVVKVASTEEQATQWLAEHPRDWDVALVDLFLEKGHGFNVLRSCRSRQPHQRAVVVTSYSRDEARRYAELAGADEVFDKFLEMDELIDYLIRMNKSFQPAPPVPPH
jgi:CheY-like chemotaxis protein